MAVTAPSTRPPGRPRAFDLDAVLDCAVEVFRDRGYEAASMADIERATGLNTSSIYNTFGSKAELFHQALHRYESQRVAVMRDVLASGTEGIDDLHRALHLQEAESNSEWGLQGCLAINAMIEVGTRGTEAKEPLAEFRRGMADAIRMPIERAVARGEMLADQAANAVALLVSLTMGLGVLMRSGASDEERAAHFAASHAVVESWRIR